jgi:hypothetical protein
MQFLNGRIHTSSSNNLSVVPVTKRPILADLYKQRIETTFQDRYNPKIWVKISILGIRLLYVPKVPMEIGGVEIFVRLELDQTVEDPDVVYRGNVLKLAL